MFFWLSRFKKPTEAKDKELLEIYNQLNDNNKRIIDKKANSIINTCMSLYVVLFAILVGLYIFLSVSKVGAEFGLIVAIFALLPVYCVWSASTWKKALPHQKITLVSSQVNYLLAKQKNSAN